MKKFLRKLLVYFLCWCLMLSPGTVGAVQASDILLSDVVKNAPSGYDTELLAAYEDLNVYISNYGIPASISLENFSQEYESGGYSSLDEYIDRIYAYFGTMQTGSNGSISGYTLSTSNWYYNTGTNLTTNPDYSRYNLLNIVQAGDIIYEAEGGSGITGHICIVEGIFYDASYGRYYIRIIEAIGYSSGSGQGDGVCRGVLDDDRLDNRDGTVLRVSTASSDQIEGELSFCIGQIGKDYAADLVKDTAESEVDWYCSELVWAAFLSEGIDLDPDAASVVVWPDDIVDSPHTSVLTVSSIGTPLDLQITMNGSNNVNITWSAVSGASLYDIYYSDTATGSYNFLTTVSSTSYTSSLANGATRYYRVKAYGNGVASNLSDPKCVKNEFSDPVIQNIYTPSSTSISITWNSVRDASSYRVYRATGSNSNYSLITTTSSPTYTDEGLTSGTLYYYKVDAVNGSESTSMSGFRCKRPTKVLTPQIYYSVYKIDESVEIKWSHIPGATSYSVYMATNQYTQNFESVYETGMTTCSFVPSVSSSMYMFKVIAHGTNGDSEFSSTIYLSTE